MWHQRNGRDWTAEAFLTSEQGLGLDVANLDVIDFGKCKWH